MRRTRRACSDLAGHPASLAATATATVPEAAGGDLPASALCGAAVLVAVVDATRRWPTLVLGETILSTPVGVADGRDSFSFAC